MGLTDKTVVYQTTDVEANVEPVVLFSIIDHFSRRGEGQDFVIGTLLGTEENGVVTISVAFPVPHMQVEDQMALSTDFHATMLSLHQRVHSKQTVVGWYSTGEAINANTLFNWGALSGGSLISSTGPSSPSTIGDTLNLWPASLARVHGMKVVGGDLHCDRVNGWERVAG